MAQERRLWKIVLTNFINSLKPRKFFGELVGEDKFGNRYYEISGTKYKQRPERYFEPLKKEDFEAEMPSEWEAWLRNRRKFPPTAEEIAASFELMKQKKEGALKIAEEFPSKIQQLPTPEKDVGDFPKYGDHYEINPGQSRKE